SQLADGWRPEHSLRVRKVLRSLIGPLLADAIANPVHQLRKSRKAAAVSTGAPVRMRPGHYARLPVLLHGIAPDSLPQCLMCSGQWIRSSPGWRFVSFRRLFTTKDTEDAARFLCAPSCPLWSILLQHPHGRIVPEHWSRKEQGIDSIQHAAMARQQSAGILHVRSPLNHRLD